MIHEIFMPALSSTMTEGKITAWVKATGDKVAKGETVVVVESDKADMDVESFYEGYLGQILVPAGESAPVGQAIAYVAETLAELGATPQPPAHKPAESTPPPSFHAPQTLVAEPSPQAIAAIPETVTAMEGRLIVSPRAKRLAQEHNIDLRSVKGTGPNGRVREADILSQVNPAAPVPVASAVKPVITQPQLPADTAAPLTTLQQAVVRNMNASLQVPVFRVGYTITTDALDQLYKQVKSKGVTMTALLAKAIALTLKKHPLLNASFTEQGIVSHSQINIAVAVAMDDGGLITPVLAAADQSDLYTLSRTWKSLVERARAKQLQPHEYSTGTFTISNLGMFGVDRFDAILPPGTGAILAVGASQPQVVATADGAIAIRSQMQVNLTCDHRVIYGAHAAQFLQDFAKLLEAEAQSLTL
ncbi:MAG: 2-oxo acid dehydrogenase subunit E2 [Oscillatoriales cyanobacterium SM2_2_1]|nr:2-oxo acid dehydrogenase subunit E2 [Oscillatoriales cyanobacterium SM2_2_1]